MIPNVVKGRGFRGLTNYLLVGRKNAHIVAGNMVGKDALELAREFGICRRLRPRVQSPVMHHTLSFADGEDPGDQVLAKIAESYIQKMRLEDHQWVSVVHRDKPHAHIHLAINRIGFDGQWWNATHDWERAQVIAAQVEVEIGLVQVPRIRLRGAIQKSLEEHQIAPPNVPLAPPKDVEAPKTVLGDLRERLETLPVGLQAPDWIRAAKAIGVSLKPSIGGMKISGFTAALSGHRAVKLSDIHRSLSWPNLLKSGRVLYDPESHFEAIAFPKGKEPTNAQERPGADDPNPAHELDPGTLPTPDGGMAYRWQSVQPGLVAFEMGEGHGADTPGSLGGSRQYSEALTAHEADRVPASESRTAGSPAGPKKGERASARLLGDGGPDLPASLAEDLELRVPSDGPGEHLLDGDSKLGSRDGSHRNHGVAASRPDAGPQGSPASSAPLGGLSVPSRGGVPSWSFSHAEAPRGANPWSLLEGGLSLRGDARELIGAKEDIADLGLPWKYLPASLGRAASRIIAAEEGELIYPGDFHRKVRERLTFWDETQRNALNPQQYRQAKALASSVSQQLAPAKAVMEMLSRQTKPTQGGTKQANAVVRPHPHVLEGASAGDDIDLDAPYRSGGKSNKPPEPRKPKRFPARKAVSLTGFITDQAAIALGPVAANLRADRAAALVIAQEAQGLLPHREFKTRVAERLKLWQEAEERQLSEADYLHEKDLRMPLATPVSRPPEPPTKWKPLGTLGWAGRAVAPRSLIGCATDWADRMSPEMPMPRNLHAAARLLVARETGCLLYPVDFALRAELRESLWELAEELKLRPEEYRQIRDSILKKPEKAMRLPRTKFKDLLREVHLAGAQDPIHGITLMSEPDAGQTGISIDPAVTRPSIKISKQKSRNTH